MMTNFKLMKEQQKQHLIDMMKADEELGLYNEETIIQAKYRLYKEYWNEDHTQLVKSNFLNGFEEGAKWQQERINEMFNTLKRNSVDNVATITNVDLFISSWKRELKNK